MRRGLDRVVWEAWPFGAEHDRRLGWGSKISNVDVAARRECDGFEAALVQFV